MFYFYSPFYTVSFPIQRQTQVAFQWSHLNYKDKLVNSEVHELLAFTTNGPMELIKVGVTMSYSQYARGDWNAAV